MRIRYTSLVVFLAAIELSAIDSAALERPKASASGLIYLLKADRADSPSRDLAKEPCWTNSHVDGVLLRTHWNKIQPRPGKIDWSFFDNGVALAAQYRKKVGLLITAGVTTPDWVYAAGAPVLAVNTLHSRKESSLMRQPLPWDGIFQGEWGKVIREFGTRYDNNPQVAYVVIGGAGRKAEAFFVSTPADVAAFEKVGGLPAWTLGVRWITNQYAKYFVRTPFLLDLGAPVPSVAGRAALAEVCDYGARSYPHRFGVKSDGLTPNYDLNSLGAKKVAALTATTTVGFQMSVPSKGKANPQGSPLLADALSRGIGLGAHFIEVYAVDCNDLRNTQILEEAAEKLKDIGARQDSTGEQR